jgi:hypothetical protein
MILTDREKHSLPRRKIILVDGEKHALPPRKIILADREYTLSILEK